MIGCFFDQSIQTEYRTIRLYRYIKSVNKYCKITAIDNSYRYIYLQFTMHTFSTVQINLLSYGKLNGIYMLVLMYQHI